MITELSIFINEQHADLDSLRAQVRELVYSNSLLSDPDGDTIFHAKKIAREHNKANPDHKIKFNDILAGMRPSGALRRPVWDSTGKIVPWEKLYR